MKNNKVVVLLNPPLSGMRPPFIHWGKGKNLKGFTLIELLVVVLIIAILAAVAMPQYNKAVKKAKGREVLVALNSLDKALAAYYLENGSFKGAADGLNIEAPILSHFRYTVGTGSFAGAVTSVHAQIGSWESPLESWWNNGDNLQVSLVSPENISVISNWEKGKLKNRVCKRVNGGYDSAVSCADYFNCNTSPVQRYENDPQLGCTTQYTYVGGECTL